MEEKCEDIQEAVKWKTNNTILMAKRKKDNFKQWSINHYTEN